MENLSLEDYVRQVKKNSQPEDVLNIWNTVMRQEKWHFVTIYREKLEERRPFIGVVHDKPWFFVFTNRQKAFEYAKTDKRFLGPEGETYIISQPVEAALKMVFEAEEKGVYGLMMNESDRETDANFNLPTHILREIIRILNQAPK